MATCSLIIHLAPSATRDDLAFAVAGESAITIGPASHLRVAAVLQTESPQADEDYGRWLGDLPEVAWVEWLRIDYDQETNLTSTDFQRQRRRPSTFFPEDLPLAALCPGPHPAPESHLDDPLSPAKHVANSCFSGDL